MGIYVVVLFASDSSGYNVSLVVRSERAASAESAISQAREHYSFDDRGLTIEATATLLDGKEESVEIFHDNI